MADTLDIKPEVVDILAALQGEGHDAYIVGGAVRDHLLSLVPKDYDIATSATPEEVKTLFGRRARIIGRRFRLVHLHEGRICYEVSTFRREPTMDERRGRASDNGVMIWRDNVFGDINQDAVRRDFTVNAVYYDPVGGKGIMDFVGGMADLESGTVRAIGEPAVRLAEDPVRMLRALKLAGEYGFELESQLADAIRAQATAIDQCSPARLFEELLKIYAKPHLGRTLAVLHQHGVLAHFLPATAAMWQTPTGDLTRQLIAERDLRKVAPNYSRSRALAIITHIAPAIAEHLNWDLANGPWEYEPGIESAIQDWLRDFFLPLPMPRFLIARARDALLLLSRFRNHEHTARLLHHPEYGYARELLSLLTTVCGWDPHRLEDWPVQGHGRPGRRRQQIRGKHVTRSHKKHWEQT